MSEAWHDLLRHALASDEELRDARLMTFDDGSANVAFPIADTPWIVWFAPWEGWLVAMCPARWGHGLETADFARALHANRAASVWRWAAHDNYLCLRSELPLEGGEPDAFAAFARRSFRELAAIVRRFALAEQPDVGRPRGREEAAS